MEFYRKGERHESFKEFRLRDGTVIGVFQGTYGEKPDLDILIKYVEPGKRIRTPQHIHWAIDLLIKKEHNTPLTRKFLGFLLEVWNQTLPFATKKEQQSCDLHFSSDEKLNEFSELDDYGEYSVEFIAKTMELMMIEEKTGREGAFMFRDVLESLLAGKDIFTIVSTARYNGR